MAASGNQSNKQMKKVESRKPHSWWWDNHVSSKNTKWLAENLEDMDRSVKRMLKLIEEDGESLAKKAAMYYQKRPELISHVQDFYRVYRSLAERYDQVTLELRKNAPSDLQSQCSGISDTASEPSSNWSSPSRFGRRVSSNRAAGFDFFLGSAGNGSDAGQKEGDESPTLTDSDGESDVSSVNNYSVLSGNGGEYGVNRRIMELEVELREVKEKLMQEEENAEGSFLEVRNEDHEDINAKIDGYEQEVRNLNEKLRLSGEEINELKIELQRYRSLESTKVKKFSEPGTKNESVVEELRTTPEKQVDSLKSEAGQLSERIQKLQHQLDLVSKEVAAWKNKFNSEKRENTKLQERLARLKTSLLDRDHEIRDLKMAVSDAEEKIFPEKAQLKAEMSKLVAERTHLEEQVREWESRGRSFEDEIRKINSEKINMEETLKGEIEMLKEDIMERENNIGDLNASFDALKSERDNLNAEVGSLKGEVIARDDLIEQMDKNLNRLRVEHKELIAGMEELKSTAKQLEEEVERQKVEILEIAEAKREAIRQLCFSLVHYQDEYQMLRQASRLHL